MPAPSNPNVAYRSGDFTVATAVSLPVFDAPFKEDGVNIDYVLTQQFEILLANFSRLALGTAHPDYADFILVQESELSDMGGGVVRWTRTYAKVPDEYTKASGSYVFTFPGFSGLVTGGVVGYGGSDDGRVPLTKTVPALITRTFYNTTDPANDIPILEKFQVTYGTSNVATDYVNDNATNPNYDDTAPSRTEYDAQVAAGDLLVAQDSTWDIWLGTIYVRETYYVKAQ